MDTAVKKEPAHLTMQRSRSLTAQGGKAVDRKGQGLHGRGSARARKHGSAQPEQGAGHAVGNASNQLNQQEAKEGNDNATKANASDQREDGKDAQDQKGEWVHGSLLGDDVALHVSNLEGFGRQGLVHEVALGAVRWGQFINPVAGAMQCLAVRMHMKRAGFLDDLVDSHSSIHLRRLGGALGMSLISSRQGSAPGISDANKAGLDEAARDERRWCPPTIKGQWSHHNLIAFERGGHGKQWDERTNCTSAVRAVHGFSWADARSNRHHRHSPACDGDDVPALGGAAERDAARDGESERVGSRGGLASGISSGNRSRDSDIAVSMTSGGSLGPLATRDAAAASMDLMRSTMARPFSGRLCGYLGGAFELDQLGPDAMPVAWTHVPPHDDLVGRGFERHAKLRARHAGILAASELGQVHAGDADLGSQSGHAAAGEFFGEFSEVHGMHSAQLGTKHTAQRAVMQVAYAERMKKTELALAADQMEERPFRRNRRLRLAELIGEAGGVVALSEIIGTPKSHISAMQNESRGIGDELATKAEKLMDKPFGWMDTNPQGEATPEPAPAQQPVTVETVILRLSEYLMGANEVVKITAPQLLLRLGQNPGEAVDIAKALTLLLGVSEAGPQPPNQQGAQGWNGLGSQGSYVEHAPTMAAPPPLIIPNESDKRSGEE